MQLKLGKKPAQPNAIRFRLGQFVNKRLIPPVPQDFGHEAMVPDWGVLGNDKWGCCVFSGIAHQSMLACAEGKRPIPTFTEDNIAADYGAVTGFNPSDPSTDQGTMVDDGMRYWRTTGVADASGRRHKIAAYLALDLMSVEDLWASMYLFGSCGIGFRVPNYAMQQFQDGKPWDLDPNGDGTIEGGHYVPLVARRGGVIYCVTWGKVHPMTLRFYREFNDESAAAVPEEIVADDGKSPEGFDREQLIADLRAL